MNLRVRTVIIFFITVVLAAAAALLVGRSFYLRGFSGIEEREAYESLRRAEALVNDDLDALELTVRDWGSWDEAYDFLHGKNPGFAKANLDDQFFRNLGLSAACFLDAAGQISYAYFEPEEDMKGFLRLLRRFEASDLKGEGRGVIRIGGDFHLVVLRPVLRSDESGPPSGMLAMARHLDEDRLGRYSRLLGISAMTGSLSPEAPALARDDASIRAWAPLRDLQGEAVGLLGIESPRLIYRYASSTLPYFLVATALAIVGVGLSSALILETFVLRRVKRIGEALDHIAREENLDARLEIRGRDELAAFVGLVNRTLAVLSARVREREAMLREIHHRVKNNLQVIASLLSLQAADSRGEEAEAALLEGRRRVLAMAQVHEELYADPNIAKIDLQGFLERFSRSLEPMGQGMGAVELSVEAGRFDLEIERAVPLGLILSEILSNSYRHAFPDRRKGRIKIRAEAGTDGGFEVEVWDDGIGIKPGTEGLGLTLVSMLSRQIGGSSSIMPAPEGGTLFRLKVEDSGALRERA